MLIIMPEIDCIFYRSLIETVNARRTPSHNHATSDTSNERTIQRSKRTKRPSITPAGRTSQVLATTITPTDIISNQSTAADEKDNVRQKLL